MRTCLLILLLAAPAAAQLPLGIQLNPGERLIAIDGQPVAQERYYGRAPTRKYFATKPYKTPNYITQWPAAQAAGWQPATPGQALAGPPGSLNGAERYIVNRHPAAFAHTLREAQMLADYFDRTGRHGGHMLGVSPGATQNGTGYSWRPQPHHCLQELPSSRIVARAVVRSRRGAYHWSANYR